MQTLCEVIGSLCEVSESLCEPCEILLKACAKCDTMSAMSTKTCANPDMRKPGRKPILDTLRPSEIERLLDGLVLGIPVRKLSSMIGVSVSAIQALKKQGGRNGNA